MMLPMLLMSLVSGTAQAECIDPEPTIFPNPAYESMQDAVDAAAEDGGRIQIVPGDPTYYDGSFVIQGHWRPVETIVISNGAHICIEAISPPSQLDDSDLDEDVYVEPDFVSIISNIYTTYQGVFRVTGGSTLELRNLHFKGIEWVCDDGADNDGNGLIDAEDPACEISFTDTAGGGGNPPLPPFGRLVTADPESALVIEDCVIQGFAAAFEGSVIRAEEAEITLVDNMIGFNRSPPFLTANNWFTEGEGGVLHLRDSSLVATGNQFLSNVARYGGVIWARGPNRQMILRDNTFVGNEAEDGGAIYGENIDLLVENNFFINNTANIVPASGVPLWFPNEGGAVWVEDSRLRVNNNVFHMNGALDYGSSISVTRNLTGGDIDVYHNTFLNNTTGSANGGTVMFRDTPFTFWNNIVQNSFGGAVAALDYPGLAAPYVEYNDFFFSSPVFTGDLAVFPVGTLTNLSAAPQIVYYSDEATDNWETMRYWAAPTSPTINAGDPLTAPDPWNDGIAPDLGAYGGAAAMAHDNDGDNWPSIHDCDDTDPSIYPLASEPCDNFDNDCDGIIDNAETRWFEDKDYDGYGDPNVPPVEACPTDTLPGIIGGGIYVTNNDDCDDNNARMNPGTPEYCDDLDNDCDGQVDEEILPRLQYPDSDGDGFGNMNAGLSAVTLSCPPPGFSPFGTDCNDSNDDIHPLVTLANIVHTPLSSHPIETSEASRSLSYVADGVDQDCDGFDLCYADLDGDSFGAEQLPNEPPQYMVDTDLSCANLSAPTATTATDCDDRDPLAYPGGTEITADGQDQNCDGRDQCWEDADGDGYGSDQVLIDTDLDCDNASANTSSRGGDCDDRPNIGQDANPEEEEVCDGLDNNCDGQVDEVSSPDAVVYFIDADSDGFGLVSTTVKACALPDGYAEIAGDCDDDDARAYPGNNEVCDGVDNNCSNGIDEDSSLDVITWYEDLDGDGFGDHAYYEVACDEPTEGGPWVRAGKAEDCNDADPTVAPGECSGCSVYMPQQSQRSVQLLLLACAASLLRRRGRRAA
jgi:predicted outer membrane repeat protein